VQTDLTLNYVDKFLESNDPLRFHSFIVVSLEHENTKREKIKFVSQIMIKFLHTCLIFLNPNQLIYPISVFIQISLKSILKVKSIVFQDLITSLDS
jgi:hypothetical protein